MTTVVSFMPKISATKLTEAGLSRVTTPPKGERVERPDLLAPGLILRVNDKGVRSWIVRFRVNGRQAKMALGNWPALSLENARRLSRQAREQAAAGIDPRKAKEAEKAERKRVAKTFGDLTSDFLAEWTPSGANTHREMSTTVRLHLEPLAEVRLIDLHRSHLGDIVAALSNPRRPDGGKPGAARKAYEAARRIASWGVRRGKLEHDPFAMMEPPPKGRPRDRTLEPWEIRLLWSVTDDYPFGALQRFLLLTATRRNEAAEMTWREVDELATWTIPAERTKNRIGHVVPLSEQAKALLGTLPRWTGPFVFSTTDGMKPVSGFTNAKRRIDWRIRERAKMQRIDPPLPWSLHDLRRTARTGFARLGVPREVAERCLNHVGGSQLELTYDRWRYEEEKRDAFKLWGAELERIMSSEGEYRD